MSQSEAHDSLIAPVARYLSEQCQCKRIVREPARPSAWGPEPWPSPDVFAWTNGAFFTVAVDIKRSLGDSKAQFDKPYVNGEALGVGLTRYIASPVGVDVAVPLGYGLLRVNDSGEVTEVETSRSWDRTERNWRAEAHMLYHAETTDPKGTKGSPFTQANSDIRKYVGDYGIGFGTLKKRLGMSEADLKRAIARDPGLEIIAPHNLGGRTVKRKKAG